MRNLKKVLALVLAMAMSLSLAVTAGAAYKDGDKISAEYEVAVEVASQLGILEGFEDGSYGPQKNLTRAQLATMTYRLATADVDDVYTADFAGGAAAAFTDTAATAWYAGYVGYAADAGYLKGCGEGLYKPESALTGYQALAAFLRVIGYNQPGQFTGADWTVQVAQVATQNGLLKGIEGVDLQSPITREVAAQIIYNALFAQRVFYTPAFGYQLSTKMHPIADDMFGIVTGKAGVIEPTAPWGQPANVWNDKDGDAVVTVMEKPVAEYTAAISECDMAKDLGLDEDAAVSKLYVNGASVSRATEFNADREITLIDTKTEIGDQGTLVEVYEIDEEYWVVEIETFLGKIGETKDAVVDKNGHEKSPATAELDVFCTDYALDAMGKDALETADFAEDEYVLVNYSFMEDEYFLTSTAPVATETQTYINTKDEYSVIGEKYNWAAHYEAEGGFYGKVNVEYNVFVDFYGNLIGIFEPDPADPVYTIWESAIAETGKYDPAVIGKVVDLTTGELKQVELCEEDAKDWNCHEITYKHEIVSYEVCDDGCYVLTDADVIVGNKYEFVNDDPEFKVNDVVYGADDNTIFAVETECGEYDIYVGYENVPSFNGEGKVEILNSDKDKWIEIVYVDASNAIFAGEEIFAYVMNNCAGTGAGILPNDAKYDTYGDVVIDGVAVDVKTTQDVKMGTYQGKFVTLYTNDDGLVYKVEVIDVHADADWVCTSIVEDIADNEVAFADGSFHELADGVVVWVIVDGDSAKVGTVADIEKGDKVDFELNADDEIAFITVWDVAE